MKNKIIALLVILVLLADVVAGIALFKSSSFKLSGITAGNEYAYQQFSGSIATSTSIAVGSRTLGSVIITEDSATAVTFWDATSTGAVTDTTYATKVAVMEATLAEGTYVFDLQLNRGLIMVSTDGYSFAGDWTVTYR